MIVDAGDTSNSRSIIVHEHTIHTFPTFFDYLQWKKMHRPYIALPNHYAESVLTVEGERAQMLEVDAQMGARSAEREVTR